MVRFKVGQTLRIRGGKTFPFVVDYKVVRATTKLGSTKLSKGASLDATEDSLVLWPVDENCVAVADVEIVKKGGK